MSRRLNLRFWGALDARDLSPLAVKLNRGGKTDCKDDDLADIPEPPV
ncbi:MAG: hypothetical protein Q7S26_04515 [bacterium]|nr:hypothetical protein [bacterium]